MRLEFPPATLIVSCQPVNGGPLDSPQIVAALARAALSSGAGALRIEGIDNLRAVRAVTDAPIIGLIKRDLPESPVRISPLLDDLEQLAMAGADIIAFDATDRPRPVPVAQLAARVRELDSVAMADVSSIDEARIAHALDIPWIGTTLAGYTGGGPEPVEPDLTLVADIAAFHTHVIAEGNIRTPAQAAMALTKGARAVVVGSAITRPEHITQWFVDAMRDTAQSRP